MSNMSYCRFQNTLADVYDCMNAIEEGETLSEQEADSAKKLFKTVLEVALDNRIISEWSEENIDTMIDEISE